MTDQLTQDDYARLFDEQTVVSDVKRQKYDDLAKAAGQFKEMVHDHCPSGPDTDKILAIIHCALIQATVTIANRD